MLNKNLFEQFEVIGERIEILDEAYKAGNIKNLDLLVADASAICRDLLVMYAVAYKKSMPDSDDLLVLFKAFVKGDTSLTAVRDNVRELVYYRNCINEDRHDALPKKPEKMTLHTVRHVYFYLRSRADQEGLLD